MKSETLTLLQNYHTSGKIKFISTNLGLELEHSLSDEEKFQIVTTEYGTSLVNTTDDLFVTIIKKLVRNARKEKDLDFKDRLSEL